MRHNKVGSYIGLLAVAAFVAAVVWATNQKTGYTSRASMETSVGGYVERRYR